MNQAQEDSSPHVSDAGGLSVERLAFKSGSTLPSEGLSFNLEILGVGPGAQPSSPCSEGLGGGGVGFVLLSFCFPVSATVFDCWELLAGGQVEPMTLELRVVSLSPILEWRLLKILKKKKNS